MQKYTDDLEIHDVAIIGAGPIGMIATYYCGTRALNTVLIDILDQLGGQCNALYPEKMIYDVAGQPGCTGAELISSLGKQLKNVGYKLSLNTSIQNLSKEGDIWLLQGQTTDGTPKEIRAKVVIVAIGKGAFEPRKLNVPGEDLDGIFYTVQKIEEFAGQNVLIVGGGDSAFDWSITLKNKASSLTQIHRSNIFRAHASSVNQIREAHEQGQMELLEFNEVKEFRPSKQKTSQIGQAVLFHNKTKEERIIDVDRVVINVGFLTKLGEIKNWGLEIDETQKVIVDPLQGYATNLPGIFAIGDVAHFPGKVELITTGFGEAATAAYYAYKHIHGDIKGAAWCAKLPV